MTPNTPIFNATSVRSTKDIIQFINVSFGNAVFSKDGDQTKYVFSARQLDSLITTINDLIENKSYKNAKNALDIQRGIFHQAKRAISNDNKKSAFRPN